MQNMLLDVVKNVVMNVMHTKKYTVSMIVAFALFFFAGIVASVLAQTDTTIPASEVREDAAQKQIEAKNFVGNALGDLRQKRIINLCANISNRFDALVLRLERIALRIDARIAKLEQAGTDMSNAKNALASVQVSLTAAKTSLAAIDQMVQEFVTSENPQMRWGEVRKQFIDVHTYIQSAKADLENAVDALTQRSSETTTASSTNQ